MPEKIYLYGLAYDCPFHDRKLDCPFKEQDNLSFKGRVEWINGISKEKELAIMEHHQDCSKNR